MSLLNWFFEKISPETSTNWLAARFAMWHLSRRERYNRVFLNNPDYPCRTFNVAGCSGIGKIVISERPDCITGQSAGFIFNVSWNESGFYCGVVLGLEEAKKLAAHIMEKSSQLDRNEKQIVEEYYTKWNVNHS